MNKIFNVKKESKLSWNACCLDNLYLSPPSTSANTVQIHLIPRKEGWRGEGKKNTHTQGNQKQKKRFLIKKHKLIAVHG
jgi:hypothetical protein